MLYSDNPSIIIQPDPLTKSHLSLLKEECLNRIQRLTDQIDAFKLTDKKEYATKKAYNIAYKAATKNMRTLECASNFLLMIRYGLEEHLDNK